MSAGGRIAFVVVGATFLSLFAWSLPATAHPSAFETLTLDFPVAPRTLAPTDQPVSILVKPREVSLPTTTTATSSDPQSGADSSPDDAAAGQSDDEDGDSFPLGIVVIAAVLVGLAAASVIWYST
jgi:hypothetical protein